MALPEPQPCPEDLAWMDLALRLARRGYGMTSPNPMVGAVLVRHGQLIGRGWHHRAGEPHAEIEAIHDAQSQGQTLAGASLYVTLEPCCTHGRTPPCTEAILNSGISRVIAGTTDPNPKHSGRGFERLRSAGLSVLTGVRAEAAAGLNEAFNHWIVHRTPWITVKAAMSLDGKIATASGQSRWITGPRARAFGMRLRQGADAILVGIHTLLSDDPMLTVRRGDIETGKPLRRIVLDSQARTPLSARILSDAHPELTTIVVGAHAPSRRLAQLSKRASVLPAPLVGGRIDVRWLLERLGGNGVTHLLVEGGGEVNASFLLGRLAHRIAFFYAPKIIGGRTAPGAIGSDGVASLAQAVPLLDLRWRRLDEDLLLTARVAPFQAR